jgi:uncharacterized membrane protein YhaH (DUF805 family)
MKWFINALKQYASFSGRAQRKEYWYFALFSSIISIFWGLSMSVLFAATQPRLVLSAAVPGMCYTLAILMPALAVAVRRLHDTGRSGGWIFITLIPVIGGIWFLVLMVLDSQPGDNRYGPNPKILPTRLDKQAALKGAGIMLIFTTIAIMLAVLGRQLIFLHFFVRWNFPFHLLIVQNIGTVIAIILLIAGICLANGKIKPAYIALLIAGAVGVIITSGSLMSSMRLMNDNPRVWGVLGGWANVCAITAQILVYLLLVLVFAANLFSPHISRKAAVALMTVAGISLIFITYRQMVRIEFSDGWAILQNWLSAFYILEPVALMVLAGASLTERKNSEVEIEMEKKPLTEPVIHQRRSAVWFILSLSLAIIFAVALFIWFGVDDRKMRVVTDGATNSFSFVDAASGDKIGPYSVIKLGEKAVVDTEVVSMGVAFAVNAGQISRTRTETGMRINMDGVRVITSHAVLKYKLENGILTIID